MIYNDRLVAYVNDLGTSRNNKDQSPIFEILNTSLRFGLLDTILEMSF